MGNKHKRKNGLGRLILTGAIAGTLGVSLGNLYRINQHKGPLSTIEQTLEKSLYETDLLVNYIITIEEEIPSDLGDLERAARNSGINVDSIKAQYKF